MTARYSAMRLEAALEGAFGPFAKAWARLQLRRHPDWRDQLEAHAALGRALRATLPPVALPVGLAGRIEAVIAREQEPPVARERLPRRPASLARAVPFAGTGLAGLAAGVVLMLAVAPNPAADPLRHSLIDDHVRSLQGDHLTDVANSDRHTVKPWLSARLGVSPPVRDIPGFPLAGGRLDVVAGHDAATVVYRRREHVINVFAWPTAEADTTPAHASDRGFYIVRWRRGGLELAAVSDLNMSELQDFVRQLDAPP